MPRKQKGGKVLGRGGYGCAVAPAKMCNSKMNPENKVSKYIDMSRMDDEEKEELIEEFKISLKFKKVDPKNKYFLGGIDKCNISSKDVKKSDLKGCKFSTKKEIPLMNIIMKKGKDFEKVAPKLSEEDLIKSIAHLLNGAKKAVYELGLVLLDVKYLNILYVNSEEKDKIHPVFIDFGPALIPQSKREFNFSLKAFDSFYPVWPLEMLLTMYMNAQKKPVESMINWKEHFDSKKEMMDVLKANKKMDLEEFAQDIKEYNRFDIKKRKPEMEILVRQFKSDIKSKYKMIMDKIMVYEIANSFRHLAEKKPKLEKLLINMLSVDYKIRPTIAQTLKQIEKIIGSVKEKDLLISHKKLNIFQKFHRFMSKPVNNGQKGAGPMKCKCKGKKCSKKCQKKKVKKSKKKVVKKKVVKKKVVKKKVVKRGKK